MYIASHSLEGKFELRVFGQIEILVNVDAGLGASQPLECPWKAKDREIIRREAIIAKSLDGAPNPLGSLPQVDKSCSNHKG